MSERLFSGVLPCRFGGINSFSHKAVWHSAMDFAIDKAEE